jgi:galactokinase
MIKTDINSQEFLNRLAVVYGDDAPAQQKRYFALAERFEKEFNSQSNMRFFSAPGRTEVGGNHTDHNNGKVLAAAVNLDAIAVVNQRDDGVICINSGSTTLPKNNTKNSYLIIDNQDIYLKDLERNIIDSIKVK